MAIEYASPVLSYITGNTIQALRHKSPILKRLVGSLGKQPLMHGLRGESPRVGALGALSSVGGEQFADGYSLMHDVGARLAKMKPTERVMLVRRLRKDLGNSKYLKDAPFTGDLYTALSSIPESELLHVTPAKSSLLTAKRALTAEDLSKAKKAGKAITGARWGGAAIGAGAMAAGAPIPLVAVTAPTFMAADVGRVLRRLTGTTPTTGSATSALLGGLAGKKPSLTGVRSGRLGQYLIGSSEPELMDLGTAFRKELQHNPKLAESVYKDAVNLAIVSPKTLKERFGSWAAKKVGPGIWKDVAEAADKNPAILPSIQKSKSNADVAGKLTALRVRQQLGLAPSTNLPGLTEVLKSLIGGNKA